MRPLSSFRYSSRRARRRGQLEPRAYSNVPGMNFFIAGYTYSSGGLSTDPALPLDNASPRHLCALHRLCAGFDAWGKSGNSTRSSPPLPCPGEAESDGVPVSREISAPRPSVPPDGQPVRRAGDGAGGVPSYRQDLIVGVSLQVGVPLGQYDPPARQPRHQPLDFPAGGGRFQEVRLHDRRSRTGSELLHHERRLLRRQAARAGPGRFGQLHSSSSFQGGVGLR